MLVEDEVRRDADRLLGLLGEQRIARLFLPFVALQGLAEAAARDGGSEMSLSEVITAGEQLKTTGALDNAWARLQAYFQTYLDFLQADCKCCPGGVLGTEFHAIPEAMREQARTLMREIYEWLVATLEHGRGEGSLSFSGRPEDKAVEIGAALQGGLQIARLAGPERFHQVLSQLSLELTGRSQYPANLAA